MAANLGHGGGDEGDRPVRSEGLTTVPFLVAQAKEQVDLRIGNRLGVDAALVDPAQGLPKVPGIDPRSRFRGG